MAKEDLYRFLWFGSGAALSAILVVSYEAWRFIPVAVAFGLLCFGCGIVLMQFIALRKQQEDFVKKSVEDANHWFKEFQGLEAEKSKFEAREQEWIDQKETFEAGRKQWEEDKEQAIWNEVVRISIDEPKKLVAIQKKYLKMLTDEATRRGGEQIDRDLDPDNNEPDEEERK